jgi:hypothetical protein
VSSDAINRLEALYFKIAALRPELRAAAIAEGCGGTVAPILNVDDFTCFINAFAQGCP